MSRIEISDPFVPTVYNPKSRQHCLSLINYTRRIVIRLRQKQKQAHLDKDPYILFLRRAEGILRIHVSKHVKCKGSKGFKEPKLHKVFPENKRSIKAQASISQDIVKTPITFKTEDLIPKEKPKMHPLYGDPTSPFFHRKVKIHAYIIQQLETGITPSEILNILKDAQENRVPDNRKVG